MPVILNADDYDVWLDPGMTDVNAVSQFLKPYNPRLMRFFPISNRINNVLHDDEECCVKVEPAQAQLFD
jgi:putative SOS response-associated peptidase YedK